MEESNVDENMMVIDPTKIKHVTIKAGTIESVSGFIDPMTHLNLDYPDHKVTDCTVAEKLEVGAKIKFGDRGLAFAKVSRSSYDHFGKVDYTQRLTDMVDAVKKKIDDKRRAVAKVDNG